MTAGMTNFTKVSAQAYYIGAAGSETLFRPEIPGTNFYVDSVHGSTTGNGLSWETALSTIDAAVGKCTANHGDIIWVAPGHVDEVKGATGLVCDIAGISIIGLGHGTFMPTIKLTTATAATVSVSAANVHIDNVKIISDLADVAAGITVAAAGDGFKLTNSIVTDGGLTKELVIGVSLATTITDVLIKDCCFYTDISAGTGGCASAIKFVGTHTDCRILNNYIHGNYSAACIDGITGAGIRVLIKGNDCVNIDTTAGLGINMKSDTTGMVSYNCVVGLTNDAAGVVGAALATCQNFCSNAAYASGIIIPVVDS